MANELTQDYGSCAFGPLKVLGDVVQLVDLAGSQAGMKGRGGRVLAYEAPVGVGYLVAVVD
jgi:hypothetical protein